MPELPFPEIMLRVAAPAPPIVLLAVPAKMPSAPLPRAALPAALMPIKFAVMVSPPFCTSAIPCLEKRLITSPRTVVFPPAIEIPSTLAPALVPLISITGVPAVQPGWLVPSTKTGFVIAGRAEASVMVCTPPPGILKVIEVKGRIGIDIKNCLTQRARAGIICVGHHWVRGPGERNRKQHGGQQPQGRDTCPRASSGRCGDESAHLPGSCPMRTQLIDENLLPLNCKGQNVTISKENKSLQAIVIQPEFPF